MTEELLNAQIRFIITKLRTMSSTMNTSPCFNCCIHSWSIITLLQSDFSPKLLITLACRGEQCKAPAQLPTRKLQSRQAQVPMDTKVKQTRDFRIQEWTGDVVICNMYTGLYVIVRLPLIHIQLLFNYNNGCTHIKIHLTIYHHMHPCASRS